MHGYAYEKASRQNRLLNRRLWSLPRTKRDCEVGCSANTCNCVPLTSDCRTRCWCAVLRTQVPLGSYRNPAGKAWKTAHATPFWCKNAFTTNSLNPSSVPSSLRARTCSGDQRTNIPSRDYRQPGVKRRRRLDCAFLEQS